MSARSIIIRGVVQGVGFRPFVFRLAHANSLAGWVLNGEEGVEVFVEGADPSLQAFVDELKAAPPPAARIAEIEVRTSEPTGLVDFTIRPSFRHDRPTTRIAEDLPVCDDCLRELFDPADRRYRYPYINCTNCGPRYTVVRRLPYDRPNTTLSAWPLDDYCAGEYGDPLNRRFHAQPVACPSCGPGYRLEYGDAVMSDSWLSIVQTAALISVGKIVAIKGLGGYHLSCDARNASAVQALRQRKYRKEKPFAVMVPNIEVARKIVKLESEAESLLASIARPIVLAPAREHFPGVAPDCDELGVMLPYTPLQHLLFRAGAPEILVMTSANRSSEPIAYEDSDARGRLSGIADAFLVGERPIARRMDDSVARAGVFGPAILRRARGYAPGAVTTIPVHRPILALGGDLKNTITLVVEGQAFVSQHLGDLGEYQSFRAFRETIDDFLSMYEIDCRDLLVVHDGHPQYHTARYARELNAAARIAIQHHRAHIASVLAERRAWCKKVIGVSFDGTGFGDDGTIWGGEIFVGSIEQGFARVAHLRRAVLPGGDAAAQYPLQAAAGFLAQIEALPDLSTSPFSFPKRYQDSRHLIGNAVRTFTSNSVGRLFDAAAALLGFTRAVSFEGQAAMWLEQRARSTAIPDAYAFPFDGAELDFRPLLSSVARDRARGRPIVEIARAFQRGIAFGLAAAVASLCENHHVDTVVCSGGVFQNELLLEDLKPLLESRLLSLWTNSEVPPNDGGISLGQAALAAFGASDFQPLEPTHA